MTPLDRSAGLRRERTLQSSQYRDGRFHNTDPRRMASPKLSTIGEFFFGGAARRPPGTLPVERPLDAWSRPAEALRVTWLGHSTTLLELDGVRVLTDPIWAERVSPVSFAGPRRFHATPAAIAELPALDAILISHDHFDHLDLEAVRALARVSAAPFVTSLGVGGRLERVGVPPERIVELDWWERHVVGGADLAFTATPSRHFSGRSLADRDRTLWSSWAIETGRTRVFFSGDTGLTPEYEAVRTRLGPFDLVMLEVGAFHESWSDIHLGPDNALVAFEMLGGGTLLPVHWGTFDLALHAWDDPIERLVAGARVRGQRVITPRLGRPTEPSRVEHVDPWWREVAGAIAAPGRGITARST